jgi:hypothetical protein
MLKFHPEKCSVIKLGHQKSAGKYVMRKRDEEGGVQELDLTLSLPKSQLCDS